MSGHVCHEEEGITFRAHGMGGAGGDIRSDRDIVC